MKPNPDSQLNAVELQQRLEQLELELQQAKDALQDRDLWLQLALDADGIATWQYDVVTDRTVLSERSYELLGIDPTAFDGEDETFFDYVHPDDRELLRQVDEEAFSTGTYKAEFRALHPSGEIRWLFALGRVTFNELGQPLRISGVNIDITARKQAEATLRQQAQQERALNQLKDDFLSTVSHELRTPITNVKMAAQMLEIALSQQQVNDPRVARYLRILKEQCQQEMDLINNLLDLQCLEAEAQPLQLTTIHLQSWLVNLIEPFLDRAQAQQQTLSIEVPAELPQIMSEATSLTRIITELLNNACKYTLPSEQIVVRARTEDQTLQICVCNSGAEIPAQNLPQLFDKFYRVPGTDRWRYAGTGLGLALVKCLTERLGGSVRVESDANWTRFIVQLPLTPNHLIV